MPANVESAVFSNTPAWHREGLVLDTGNNLGLTVDQAIEASGLNWRVHKTPAFTFKPDDLDKDGMPMPGAKPIRVKERYATIRDNDWTALGTVGNSWTPVQNTEGFAIVQDVMQGSDCWIEAAGALDEGRKVWILAHMPEDLTIAGEKYQQYILFTNGHDGRSSVTAAMTNVRVVCQNTLAFALDTTPRVVRVRHTSRAAQNIAEAKKILGVRDLYAEELAKQGEWLVEQSISDAEFDHFLTQLMPADEGLQHVVTMAEARREKVATLYHGANNLEPIRGTRWGALQAVVEYADYHRGFGEDHDKTLKAQFGFTEAHTRLKNEAAKILRNPDLVAA